MLRHLALPYMCVWATLVVLATLFALRERRTIARLSGGYASSLLVPWKVVTFAIAFAFFVFAAPYTGDPTWDWKDGGLMSLLTYLTAPWSVGIVARARSGQVPKRLVLVALAALMFSASWSYDGYLFLRDGAYPRTWAANIPASTALYVAAGMLFSLVHVKDRGVVFDFMTPEWKRTPRSGFGKVIAAATVLIVGVILALSPFVLEVLRSLPRR